MAEAVGVRVGVCDVVGVREGVRVCVGVGVRDGVPVGVAVGKTEPVGEGVSVAAVGTAVSLTGKTPHSS